MKSWSLDAITLSAKNHIHNVAWLSGKKRLSLISNTAITVYETALAYCYRFLASKLFAREKNQILFGICWDSFRNTNPAKLQFNIIINFFSLK